MSDAITARVAAARAALSPDDLAGWEALHEDCECGCEEGKVCPYGVELDLVPCAACHGMAVSPAVSSVCMPCEANGCQPDACVCSAEVAS